MRTRHVTAAALGTLMLVAVVWAQPPAAQPPAGQPTAGQPPAGQPPAGGGEGRGAQGRGGEGRGRGGGGFGRVPMVPFDNTEGFTQIFDGSTLKGWEGDPTFWKVEGGAIVGTSTPENLVRENTFIIWRGGETADFELKLEYRINASNSGIQFRSTHLPAGTDGGGRGGAIQGKFVLKGYQADIDFNNQFTGQIYEERGRQFLAMRGQLSTVTPAGVAQGLGSLQTGPNDLRGVFNNNNWNQVHLIAKGNLITQIVNGNVTCVLIDDDPKGRAMKGLLGFQIHTGPPMKVEFRNIWLKQY